MLLERCYSEGHKENAVRILADVLANIPWLWDLYVKKYTKHLLYEHQAAEIVYLALLEQSVSIQAKAFLSLTRRLRNADCSQIISAAPEETSLATFQKVIGLSHMSSSVEIDENVPVLLQLLLSIYLCIEGDVASFVEYISDLASALSSPDTLFERLHLVSINVGETMLSDRDVKQVLLVQALLLVVIEALCLSPELFQSYSQDSRVKIIGVMLAFHWELSKLLAAAGANEPGTVKYAAWSPKTCLCLLDAAVPVHRQEDWSTPQQLRALATLKTSQDPLAEETPPAAFLLPPTIVAHMLTIVHSALIAADKNGVGEYWPELIQKIAPIQAASYLGLARPYAVMQGDAHRGSIEAATALHDMLAALQSNENAEEQGVIVRGPCGSEGILAAGEEGNTPCVGTAFKDLVSLFQDEKPDSQSQSIRKRVVAQHVSTPSQSRMPEFVVPEQAEEEHVHHRVVIHARPNMSEEEREAMWAAYIADKEKMLELLADDRYNEWYDEGEHPLPEPQRAPDMEAALDAALGGGGDDTMRSSQLPKTVMEASLETPWQAALSAALILLETCNYPGLALDFTTNSQRDVAVAAGLRLINPHHSVIARNSACKAASELKIGGSILFYATQLHDMLQWRTGQCTAQCVLDAYAAIIRKLLAPAVSELRESRVIATDVKASRRLQPPLQLAADVLRQSFLLIHAGTLTPASAETFIKIISNGSTPDNYFPALLWLTLSGDASKLSGPRWLRKTNCKELSNHPLAAADSETRAVAVLEILEILMGALPGPDSPHELHIIMDAVHFVNTALAGYENQEDGPRLSVEEETIELILAEKGAKVITEMAICIISVCCEAAQELTSLVVNASKSAENLLQASESAPTLASLLLYATDFVDVAHEAVMALVCDSEVSASDMATLDGFVRLEEQFDYERGAFEEALGNVSEENPLFKMIRRALESVDCLFASRGLGNGKARDVSEVEEEASRKPIRRVEDVRNPYLKAIIAETNELLDEDLSELEDFIVFNPSRDYRQFIENHFPTAESSMETDDDDCDDDV